MNMRTYALHISLAIFVSLSLITIGEILRPGPSIAQKEFDTVFLTELGIDIGIDVPIEVKVPKGRLGKKDSFGRMTYNVPKFNPRIPVFAQTQVGDGSVDSLDEAIDLINEINALADGSDTSQGNQQSQGEGQGQSSGGQNEPFGGVAYGIPCCNGWWYYMQTCGKCDEAGVLESGTHLAYWYTLKKWYMPTGGNPVLGLAQDEQEECLLYIPEICDSCDCEIEAEYLDTVVGTANNPSKSSQTTE